MGLFYGITRTGNRGLQVIHRQKHLMQMLLSSELGGGSALVAGYRVQFICYPLGPQPVSPDNDVEFKHLV